MIKNGKIFGKINIFDFIVLILAILLILGGFAFFGIKALSGGSAQNTRLLKEMTYQIKLEAVRTETVDSFKAGMPVYEASSKEQIGIITSLETEDATVVMETLNGNVVSAPVEGKYDLTLTIRGLVSQTQNGDCWITDTERLLEGRNFTFITQKNKCQGMVKHVETINDLGALKTKFSAARDEYYK